MGNLKDFATSTVAVAPLPAISGTSLSVYSNNGTRFPDVPFFAVAHPVNAVPTLDNAELVSVTEVDGDTFTIVRGQGETTPKSIGVGWRISNVLLNADKADLINGVIPSSQIPDQALMFGSVESVQLLYGETEANTIAPERGTGFGGGGSFLVIKGGLGNPGDQFGGSLVLQGGDGLGNGNAGGVTITGGNTEDGLYPGNINIYGGLSNSGVRGIVYIQDVVSPSSSTDAANKQYVDQQVSSISVPVQSVNGRTGTVTGLAENSDLVAHTSNTSNPHGVTKSQVGLSNVDNTSDLDKPISTATQTALNALDIFNFNGYTIAYQPTDKFDSVQYYRNATTTWTDITAEAATSVGTVSGDVLDVIGDYFYMGKSATFDGIYIDIGTAKSASGVLSFEYWNGSTWTSISVTDGTTGLTVDGTISFTVPTDWATTTVNGTSGLYWFRIGVASGTFTNEPTVYLVVPGSGAPVMAVYANANDTVPSFVIDKQGGVAIGYANSSTSRFRVNGGVAVGGDVISTGFLIGDGLRVNDSYTPSSASDIGEKGQIAWDDNYVYVCVDTNTWKRSAISTW